MLELVYLALLLAALYLTKLAVIDSRAEIEATLCAMILFVALTPASFAVRSAFAPETTVTMRTLAWLCFGGAALNFVVLLIATTEKLSEATEEDTTYGTRSD